MDETKEPAPRISVIVPVYNGERFLAEAIESILAQTYKNYEIIVVDDGSTDRTREIASAYPQVIYLHQVNSGTAAARNRGILSARGELLAFLDADDVWVPGKLEWQMAAFEADPCVEIVSGHVEQFTSPGLEQKYHVPTSPMPGYSANAILIKRSVIEEIGLFHEDAETAETISWFAGVIDQGRRIMILQQVVARRRIHGQNASIVKSKETNRAMLGILKKSIDRKRAHGH